MLHGQCGHQDANLAARQSCFHGLYSGLQPDHPGEWDGGATSMAQLAHWVRSSQRVRRAAEKADV
jgi:hypothetical protein